MSALCGLIRFGGRPVETTDVERMRGALAVWGSDGGGTWIGESAGFAQLVAHRTPESLHERGPLVRGNGECVITAAARLDNRDELLDAFDLVDVSDSELIARAYERWEDDAPLHLFGDWAFAAWHPRARRLFLARDQYGNTAMHYYHDGRAFAFASGTKALLALEDVPRRLNELRLSQLLSLWTIDGAATIHEGVLRLPPSCAVTVHGADVRVRQYWSLDAAPEVKLTSDEETVERFLDLLTGAVRSRLRSTRPIASQLSAGLDSGSVTALAARERRVTAFTSIPVFEREAAEELRGILVNEWPLAHRTAEWCGNVDHVAVRADEITPLQGIERVLAQHGEPEIGAPNAYWNIAVLDEAHRRQCGVLLTGQAGNLGISWGGPPFLAFRALTRGDLARAWRGVSGWRKQQRHSWLRTIWHTMVRPMRSQLTTTRLRLRGVKFDAGALINPAFAERLELARRAREAGWLTKFATASPRELRFGVLAPGIAPSGAIWHEGGAHARIDARDPTADVRLIEFCYRIPDDLFARPEADRWLMRRAMDGILPPEVQWNARRGRQSADLAYRLRADAAAVSAAVERITASAACNEYLNVAQLRESWRTIADPKSKQPSDAAFPFASLLMVGLFLTKFQD